MVKFNLIIIGKRTQLIGTLMYRIPDIEKMTQAFRTMDDLILTEGHLDSLKRGKILFNFESLHN